MMLMISYGSGFHRESRTCPVLTGTRWVPKRVLLFLRRPAIYLLVCHLAPVLTLAAACFPTNHHMRCFSALAFASFSIAETAATHSHRDYANLYMLAASCVLPDELLEGAALGISVHFIGSSTLLQHMPACQQHAPASLVPIEREKGKRESSIVAGRWSGKVSCGWLELVGARQHAVRYPSNVRAIPSGGGRPACAYVGGCCATQPGRLRV